MKAVITTPALLDTHTHALTDTLLSGEHEMRADIDFVLIDAFAE